MVLSEMTAAAPVITDQKPRKRAMFFAKGQGFKSAETKMLVSFCCVIMIVSIDFVGVTIQSPLIPFYVQSFADAQELDIGFGSALLAVSYSSSQLIATPIFGCGSDRFGRRPMMLLSLIGGGIFFLGQAVAPSFKIFLIMRFMTGLFGGSRPVAAAYIGDTVPPEQQPKYLGGLSVCVSMCLMLSPALGGSMGMVSLALPCYFQVGACAVTLAISLVYLIEPDCKSGGAANTANTKNEGATGAWKLWLGANAFVGAAMMFITVCWGILFPTWANTRLNLDQNKIGLVLGGGGLMIAVAQVVVFVPLSKKLSLPIIGCVGIVFASIPCAIHLPMLQDKVWFAAAASCSHGFGMALVVPGVTTIVNMLSPPARRGLSSSMTMMAQAFTRLIAPLVGGPMYDIDYSLPFLIMTAVATCGLALEVLLIARIPVLGKSPADKKKDDDLSKEELKEEEEKKEILENLYKVHHALTLALKDWQAKRHELQLGKSPEEVGLPAVDSKDPEIADGQKSLLGFWMADMLSAHGYKNWPEFLPFIQTMCKNAFPKIRDVEWKFRADDIVYIMQSHLMLEQRWERFVLTDSDLADSPEYHLDAAAHDEHEESKEAKYQEGETRNSPRNSATSVSSRNSLTRPEFENVALAICPEAETAYV